MLPYHLVLCLVAAYDSMMPYWRLSPGVPNPHPKSCVPLAEGAEDGRGKGAM